MSDGEHIFSVAVVGPVFGFPVLEVFVGPSFEDQGPEVPYAKRLKVDVPATETTSIGDVIDRAAAEVGTTLEHGRVSEALEGIAFYEPEDEVVLKARHQPWPDTIRIPNDDGRPSWRVWWVATRVDELLEAHAAGLVVGDPYRPYLWPVIPQGDLLQQFHETLWTLWLNWEHILSAYGTFELARRVLRRIARGRTAFTTAEGMPWRDRLARPHDLFGYLASAPRTSDEVAALFGCDPGEAEGVLWGMGFVCDKDGVWRPAQDDASLVLYESVQQIRVLGRAPRRAELEVMVNPVEPAAGEEQAKPDES